jgi:hypothetical protein
MERAAVPWLGALEYVVHVNGLVEQDNDHLASGPRMSFVQELGRIDISNGSLVQYAGWVVVVVGGMFIDAPPTIQRFNRAAMFAMVRAVSEQIPARATRLA